LREDDDLRRIAREPFVAGVGCENIRVIDYGVSAKKLNELSFQVSLLLLIMILLLILPKIMIRIRSRSRTENYIPMIW
jgi:hypothetical protein